MTEGVRGIVLAHLSDPHLPLPAGVRPSEVLNKRLLSLLSWHVSRHRRHRRDTLDRLVADLRAKAPGLIAVTGDLTNLGLDTEYDQAAAWLKTLGDPARVMVIPGNHDALVPGAWPRGAVKWWPWWQADGAAPAPVADAFPVLRRRGPLALIGTSSAVATMPGLAVGEVGRAQLRRLADLLTLTRAEGLCRVLMVHHPPLDGTVKARKRLRDAAALRAVLAREGVELVLHGHSHRSHVQQIETADGPASVIGVPSASSMYHEPAAYNLYHIVPGPGGWAMRLVTRQLAPHGDAETAQCLSLSLARGHAARAV